mgnify:CR=1 FL=1|jgi:hypothetical protein
MTFELQLTTDKELRDLIQVCQRQNHVQQVAFSTYHNCLTQICFDCKRIRTSMNTDNKAKANSTREKVVKGLHKDYALGKQEERE